MRLPRLLTLLLIPGAACQDLREFRIEADPPIDVIRVGTDHVGRETPFLFPIPMEMRSEPEPEAKAEGGEVDDWDKNMAPRFMTLLVRESEQKRTLYRFQKVFRYPAVRPSLLNSGRTRPQGWRDLILPGIDTSGRIWLRGSGPTFRLYAPRDGKSMLVRRPMSAQQRFYETGNPEKSMSLSGTTVQQVEPGTFVLAMAGWRLEMELPKGVSLFVDVGQGKSDYLHLSYPKNVPLGLHRSPGNADPPWIHGRQSLLAPLLTDASAWTTSLLRYGKDGIASMKIEFPDGRVFRLRVHQREARQAAPPLLLALTLGSSASL